MSEAAARRLAILEIIAIAQAPGSVEQRGVATLEALHRVVPFDMGWLSVRDPERHRHSPVATLGAGDPLRRYFQTDESEVEVDVVGLNGPRPPMLARETPRPLGELRAWAEYLWPAGLKDGVAAGLFTGGGHHVGLISLFRAAEDSLSTEDRDTLGRLVPLIAAAVDRRQALADTARIVRGAVAGVVVTRGGDVLPLDGLASPALLERGSAAVTVVAGLLDRGDRHLVFLVPRPGSEAVPVEGLLRITVFDCAQPIDHLRAVAVVSEPDDLPDVDPVDLRLIGALIEGWPAARTAATAGMTAGQLAERVRRLVATVGSGSTAGLLTRALREGLYIPATLPGPWA
jgi:hypothetical protein